MAVSPRSAGGIQERELDDGRQWFELWTTLSATTPALLRGAAASAFNESAIAEAFLRSVIRSQPRTTAASQAHEVLSRIYLRSGRYKRLIENFDEWAAAFPTRGEVQRERKDIEQFRGLPDQVNGPRRASTLQHSGDLFVPVSINGKPASYFFDTGAWVSVMTESEAARLGLEIRPGTGSLSDASGKGTKARTAVAEELTLGSMRFRHVSFAILPNAEPWLSMPPGRRGILGMPLLLGAATIRWSKNGTVEFGARLQDAGPRNLVFHKNRLLLATNVLGRRVFMTLDTGATTTDLNGNFASEFAEFVGRTGKKGTHDITGVGGTTSVDAFSLPEVIFDIGGTSAVLRSAMLALQQTPAIGGDCCVGNAGIDLLTQTPAFTIDFSAMTLRLTKLGS
jgi:predicted aspartyl protease